MNDLLLLYLQKLIGSKITDVKVGDPNAKWISVFLDSGNMLHIWGDDRYTFVSLKETEDKWRELHQTS